MAMAASVPYLARAQQPKVEVCYLDGAGFDRNRGVFGLHIGHLRDERKQLAPPMEMLPFAAAAEPETAERGAREALGVFSQ